MRQWGEWVAELARVIVAPRGVRVVVPLLVLVVGATVTLLGWVALRAATLSMARDQLTNEAVGVGRGFEYALAQADTLLRRLDTVARADDPAAPFTDGTAAALHDLMTAHAGVTYVSISFPDGTFRAAYVENGATLLQESRTTGGGTRAVYTFASGKLDKIRDEKARYDPRKRVFYKLAAERRARVWTPPYSFYKTHFTGITCAAPVYDATGALRAVVTVDYDINGLSSFIGTASYAGARTVIFDGDGTILAYAAPGGRVPAPSGDRPLHVEDLHDAVVTGLVSSTRGHAKVDRTPSFVMQGPELAAVAPIAGEPALRWYVAVLAPKSVVLGPVRALEARGLLANAVAVLLAVALGFLLARTIVRMREDVQSARASLVSAESRVRDLGSYRLVERIAAGGQGEVWRATHRLLAREAAIKLLHDSHHHTLAPVKLERFRREAQALASMRSRHTIEIFDYGVTEDGVFYYVMELLDGLDLQALVEQDGPQPAARVVAMLLQACSSLAEAHGAGLLHRDVKPANVFICRAADELDVVKLLDFGLVHAAGSVDESKGVLGTPGFMAPEQVLGQQLDARTDVYALGCVAWWLLSGRRVFECGDTTQLMVAHVEASLPSLRALVDGWLPTELERIVERCLAKAPADRPAGATELAAALRAVPIPPERAWTDAKAQPWWNGRDVVSRRGGAAQSARTIVVRQT